ncbi:hypothetical protein M431DRAFT_12975 [Trichoderma harzianum CBS 226.95]|uniref:Helicase C-terminal domain-containing protein n=1 Tax=Trichoderma harzianum CBS 226.95 TaxID=983964 RepID=A0A2T4AVZ5_TRIHA|nr:hypothetical protein M431DRAFT_12975 [Trichoderma harzianum CBS 226.95]PTB61247.1 hypothetical protein M431DRAFT_12975 [Trichoderma harzianum CBS 226.95]
MNAIPGEPHTPEASEDAFPDPLPPLDGSSSLKHRTLNCRLLPQNALGSAPPLTLNEWRLGKPLQDGFFADYFKQPCHFTRPPIDTSESLDSALRDAEKQNRKRLNGSTILDRDVARVLEPLIRQIESSENKKLDQMRMVWKKVQLLHAQFDVLWRNLETTPGVVVKTDQTVVSARSGLLLQPSEWDTILTTIACAYRLMTFFPGRFTESPADVNNTIWGHSRNNWQVALCVIDHFRFRRRKSKVPRARNFWPLRAAQWFGYDSDPEVEFVRLYARRMIDDRRFELSNMCPSVTQYSGVDLGEMADLHDINRVLGFDPASNPSSQAISWRICERISEILQMFGPSIDIEEDIKKRPNEFLFRPLQENSATVMEWLFSSAGVQYNGYLAADICRLGRIHQLNAVTDNGVDNKRDADLVSKTVQRALQILAIQKLTDVDIQDRSEIHAGNSTPRVHVRTIEMGLYEGNMSTVMYDFIMEHMYGQMPKTQDAVPLHANRGHIGKPPPTRLSNEAQKILSLASTHVDFTILSKANVRNIQLIAEFDEKLSGTAGRNAALRHDRSGGLQWYFYHTRSDSTFTVPLVGYEMMSSICFRSPKMAYVARKAMQVKQQKKRLLVYCSHTLTQAVVCALLVHVGVKTLQIRKQHTEAQRDEALALFTDPTSNVECLVTSMALDTVGIDHYACCSYGIILELPETATTLFQAISRSSSAGKFFWDILICRGTFDSYQESRLMAEQANILVAGAGARIPSEIQGRLRIICAYEVLRVCLGQRVNLYPRKGAEWELFDDEPFIKEGEFYSALAQLVLKEPHLGVHCTEENIQRISASWKPSMELTADHIRGKMLVLPDGVSLRSFENHEGEGEDENGQVDYEDTIGEEFFDCMEMCE